MFLYLNYMSEGTLICGLRGNWVVLNNCLSEGRICFLFIVWGKMCYLNVDANFLHSR